MKGFFDFTPNKNECSIMDIYIQTIMAKLSIKEKKFQEFRPNELNARLE